MLSSPSLTPSPWRLKSQRRAARWSMARKPRKVASGGRAAQAGGTGRVREADGRADGPRPVPPVRMAGEGRRAMTEPGTERAAVERVLGRVREVGDDAPADVLATFAE